MKGAEGETSYLEGYMEESNRGNTSCSQFGTAGLILFIESEAK